MVNDDNKLKVALAQIAPVWLDRASTLEKICGYISDAGNQNCDLVIFGEALLPGYPFWLSMTNGATFNDQAQKEIHAHYVRNAVCLEKGHLEKVSTLAKQFSIAVYLGIIERPLDRGGHSIYCSLIFIDKSGEIKSVHRKLQPTYEERLTWSPGDGHGLQTHMLGEFTIGGLNCWENWMPLSRTALYAMGENVHVAVWPGCDRNTIDITRFIAVESRSYSIAVSGLMRKSDFPADTPHYDMITTDAPDLLSNGGSCIANPDGTWLLTPQIDVEGLFVEELCYNRILEERQNFDPVGHYSRPDITKLTVNKERQSILHLKES